MSQYLQDKFLSTEATAVLNEGKKLWKSYFAYKDNHSIRSEFKLNRSDVGWYQIRNTLKARNRNEDHIPISFSQFDNAYKKLSSKLLPMVYELGFLKE